MSLMEQQEQQIQALAMSDDLLPAVRGEVFAELYGLTKCELRVVLAMVPGLSVKETARALGIGEATVKSHLQHVYAKTGTSKATELLHLFLSSTLMIKMTEQRARTR